MIEAVKGSEVTETHIKKWDKDGYFPVCCRLCGEITLYPKRYKSADLSSYECVNCRNLFRNKYI